MEHWPTGGQSGSHHHLSQYWCPPICCQQTYRPTRYPHPHLSRHPPATLPTPFRSALHHSMLLTPSMLPHPSAQDDGHWWRNGRGAFDRTIIGRVAISRSAAELLGHSVHIHIHLAVTVVSRCC